MYVAMRLSTTIELDTGQKVSTVTDDGLRGVLLVFDTPKEAREMFGDDCKVIEIGLEAPSS